jgi:hypothetical protein
MTAFANTIIQQVSVFPDGVAKLRNALANPSPLPGPETHWVRAAAGALSDSTCGRYEIKDDVIAAADMVHKGRVSSIVSALHLARPRHPITWLEWSAAADGVERKGWMLVTNEEMRRVIAFCFGIRGNTGRIVQLPLVGVLPILDEPLPPVTVTAAEECEFATELERFKALVEADHFRLKSSPSPLGPDPPSLERSLRQCAERRPEDIKALKYLRSAGVLYSYSIAHGDRIAVAAPMDGINPGLVELVCVLLLLNSRNAVEIGPEADLSRLNRARAKSRKTQLLPLRPVILDITRRQRAARLAGIRTTPDEIRSALVAGHFKCRRTGVFWWSAHIRQGCGDRGAEALTGREYEVR